MNHQVQVFEIDTASKPTEPLRPIDGFAVTADTLDEARLAAAERLRADGRSYATQISHVRDRPRPDRRYAIDARKIERELGWTPAETFDTPPAPPETNPARPRRARNGGR